MGGLDANWMVWVPASWSNRLTIGQFIRIVPLGTLHLSRGLSKWVASFTAGFFITQKGAFIHIYWLCVALILQLAALIEERRRNKAALPLIIVLERLCRRLSSRLAHLGPIHTVLDRASVVVKYSTAVLFVCRGRLYRRVDSVLWFR